jgi:hypothetical protein
VTGLLAHRLIRGAIDGAVTDAAALTARMLRLPATDAAGAAPGGLTLRFAGDLSAIFT